MKKTVIAGAMCAAVLVIPANAFILPYEPCTPGGEECVLDFWCTESELGGYSCMPKKQYGMDCTPDSTNECASGLICYTDENDQSLCLYDCATEDHWQKVPGSDIYEYKYCAPCNHYGDCEWKNIYRCAADYYGIVIGQDKGCTKCPSSGGIEGRSDAGTTSITGCYIPSGTTGSDASGTFTYTSKCYYSE